MAFDGTEQLTPFKDLLNSVVDAANARVQAGLATPNIVTQSVPASLAVVFPVAYAAAPVVVATPHTGSPSTRWASVASITATGFTLTTFNGASAGDVTCSWIAVGS